MHKGDWRRVGAGSALFLAAASVAAQPVALAGPAAAESALATGLEVAAAGLGAMVACCSWPHRVGHSLHCGRCGYRHDRHGKLIVVCPECGSPWRWIGWSKEGRPAGSALAASLGAALWALSCLGAMLR